MPRATIPFGRGGLGPDLERDSTRVAAEKAQRAAEYAAAVKAQAKSALQNAPKAVSKPSLKEIQQQQAADKKFRAEQYAKQIQKPKVVEKPIQSEEFVPKFEKKVRPKSELEEIADLLDLHDDMENEVCCWYGID